MIGAGRTVYRGRRRVTDQHHNRADLLGVLQSALNLSVDAFGRSDVCREEDRNGNVPNLYLGGRTRDASRVTAGGSGAARDKRDTQEKN